MFFINNSFFIFFLCVSGSSLSAIGIFAYRFLFQQGHKSEAEIFLFYTIVAFIILLFITGSLFTFSRKKIKDLEKAIDVIRNNNNFSDDKFNEFGKLGTNLKSLYQEILEISELRAMRIFFLNNMIDSLMDYTSKPLCITDISGIITFTTSHFINLYKDKNIILNKSIINDVLSYVDYKSIIIDAEQTHADVVCNTGDSLITFHPIYGKNNTIDAFLISFDKTKSQSHKTAEPYNMAANKKHIFNLFTKYFGQKHPVVSPTIVQESIKN